MKDRSGVVVLLEGSEQCGKTTLADKIHERFKADYMHGDRPTTTNFETFHKRMCIAAIELAENGHVVILDRCYISHLVYGNLFDNKVEYDPEEMHKELIKSLNSVDATLLVVYCRPDRTFEPNLRSEMYDDSDGRIQNEYDNVIERFANTSAEFIRYDWKADPSGESVLKFIEELSNGR